MGSETIAITERIAAALRVRGTASAAYRRLAILHLSDRNMLTAAMLAWRALGIADAAIEAHQRRSSAFCHSPERRAANLFLFNLDDEAPSFPESDVLTAFAAWLHARWRRRQPWPFPALSGLTFGQAAHVVDLSTLTLAGLGRVEEAESLRDFWAGIEAEMRRGSRTMLLEAMATELIGHLVITAALIDAMASGELPQRPVIPVSRVTHNPYLLERLSGRFAEPRDAEARAIETINGSRRYRLESGGTVSTVDLIAMASERWRDPGLRLVEIDPATAAEGERTLAGLGGGSWFVTLHVREVPAATYAGAMSRFRNPPIADYRHAIERIRRAGGTVIRLGDRRMTPADPDLGLIDYPFTAAKSDWMDVFLAARCRFHIGTASGMSFVPLLFGRAVLFTNWTPVKDMLGCSGVYTVFKPAADHAGRPIDLSTHFRRWPDTHRAQHAALAGIRLVDNDPGDLAAAAGFMLDTVEESGAIREPPPDEQAAIARFMLDHGFARPPRVPPAFWDRICGPAPAEWKRRR